MIGLRKLGVIAGAAAVGAALTVAGAGIAAANSSAGPSHQPAATAVRHTGPDLTCVSLWAVVNRFGHLVRAGCPGTKSKSLGGGAYQVVFYRNVRHCAYVADAGNGGSLDVPTPYFASVAGRYHNPRGVYIAMYDTMGVEMPRGFHLIVECRLPRI
jgi:hypothetical protein